MTALRQGRREGRGNITTAYLFGIVHSKFIAYNCLKVFENSTIWRPLQEDQDRSILPSFDLEERTGQRNAFPKAPSAHQENPQVVSHLQSWKANLN
jgi:hypothetical protein